MILALTIAAALTWYPSEQWRDVPDPDADSRARKGGTIRFNGSQSPKSLNAYVDNNSYTAMTFDLMYDRLLGMDSKTLDFIPQLARRWAVSADGSEFVFEIDDRARWSDGVPVSAHDVKWTFDTVMDPANDTGPWKTVLGFFESPEVIDDRTVRFRKKDAQKKDWRDILNCSTFWILPKHAFEGRSFNSVSMQGLPVSGSYRVEKVEEQIETVFARVDGWWRGDFPSCRNTCNFDRIVMRYHASNENAFESLKARKIDVYPVYTARIMAEQTRGDRFDRNWILKRRIRNHRPIGFQAFAMNMRRKPFDDLRVRKAMAMLIDRETMNRTMMSGAYFLLNSFYTDLYSQSNPCTNTLYRYDVAEAKRLLADAGYANGFEFTFLSRSSSEDKFLSLFSHALEQCGIKMNIDRKDFAGWMRDMDSFNFDMTWQSWGASLIRTPEIMWSSKEADRQGSNNTVGFKSSEVDAIIEEERQMTDMAERAAAYRRIDAIIASACPYAFLWQSDSSRILYWNKFGMPETVFSRHGDERCIFTYWWYDPDKAAELEEAVSTGGFLPAVPYEVDYGKFRGN